jgi:hypothetical protein
MPAIVRRGIMGAIPAGTTLATADDLDGVQDGSQNFDVTGCTRVIIFQHNNGTAGTTGIDVIEVSHDGGITWAADPTLLALASNDSTGTVVTTLNAAGIEPVNVALWKAGPYEGPSLLRCSRLSTQNAASAAWTSGAPTVIGIRVG